LNAPKNGGITVAIGQYFKSLKDLTGDVSNCNFFEHDAYPLIDIKVTSKRYHFESFGDMSIW